MSVADVLKQLQRLEIEIYEVIKPGVVTADALRETAEALEKVTREALHVAETLATQHSSNAQPRPQGIHDVHEVTVSGAAVKPLALEKPVMAITVFNDGPDEVLPMVNQPIRSTERKAYIKKGEVLEFKSSWPDIADAFFVCKPGKTASVRAHTWR